MLSRARTVAKTIERENWKAYQGSLYKRVQRQEELDTLLSVQRLHRYRWTILSTAPLSLSLANEFAGATESLAFNN